MKNNLISELSYNNIEKSLGLKSEFKFRSLIFESFNLGEGSIDGKKFCALGLLLSRGSERDKMCAIWNIFDEEGKEEMDRKELGTMITTLFSASLNPAIILSAEQDFPINKLVE